MPSLHADSCASSLGVNNNENICGTTLFFQLEKTQGVTTQVVHKKHSEDIQAFCKICDGFPIAITLAPHTSPRGTSRHSHTLQVAAGRSREYTGSKLFPFFLPDISTGSTRRATTWRLRQTGKRDQQEETRTTALWEFFQPGLQIVTISAPTTTGHSEARGRSRPPARSCLGGGCGGEASQRATLAAGTRVITGNGKGETLYQRMKLTQPRGRIKVLDDAPFFLDGRLFLETGWLCRRSRGWTTRGSTLHVGPKAREVLLSAAAHARCKTNKLQSQPPQA